MLKIALCDNDNLALPVISGAVDSTFRSQNVEIQTKTFMSGKDLLRSMELEEYQIIFLDIDMPQMDGIELGKKIREKTDTAEIIYVSECEDRVFEAFSVYPLGFVRKSNFLTDITDVVKLYVKKHSKAQKSELVRFTTRNQAIAVKRNRIRYIESSGNYQLLFLQGQTEPVELKMTMEKLEEALENYGFIRIHKGFLVNYLYIQGIDAKAVTLKGGTALPIGRSKVKEVKSKYLSFVDR